MDARWIDVSSDDGKSFKAYLSTPPTGKGPGIVLIQEIFGVNAHIQAVADQWALDGYLVLAPDIFWRVQSGVNLGYSESDMQRGFAIMQQMNQQQAIADIASSVRFLRQSAHACYRVASLGFCMGGLLSFLAAADAKVDAAVCYYPGGIGEKLSVVERIHCPLLVHFAEQDCFIPTQEIEATKQALATHAQASVYGYPGVEHGFNCWQRASYHQPSAALARGRSLSFLSACLN